MKRFPLVITGLVLLISGAAAPVPAIAQQARPPVQAAREPDATVDRASCVVTVRSAGGGMGRRLEIQTVNATLTSTSFVDPVIAQTLKLDATAWPKVVSFELVPAGQNATKVIVNVKPQPGLPDSPARTLLVALADRLVKTYAPDDEARLALEKRRDLLQLQQSNLQQEVTELRAKIEQLSTTSYRRSGDRSNEQPLLQLQADLDDRAARLAVLQETMQQVDDARKPLVAAAQEVAAARSELLATLTRQAASDPNAVSAADLGRAKVEAAEAVQRVAELARPSQTDPQGAWFHTILQVRMDMASLQARIARRAEPATTQPSPEDAAAEIQRLNREVLLKQSAADSARQELERLRQQIQSLGNEDRVVVIGLEEAGR